MLSFTPWPLYPREPTEQKVGWADEPVRALGIREKFLLLQQIEP